VGGETRLSPEQLLYTAGVVSEEDETKVENAASRRHRYVRVDMAGDERGERREERT